MKRVYFIKPVGLDSPVKIGCSASPECRRRALDTWSPFALEIVAEIDGSHDIERRFHALLKPWHERREWFLGSPQVWAVIEQVKRGEFDINSLPAPQNVTSNRNAGNIQRATWTPERRVQASYFARIRWAEIHSRTVCREYASMIGDPAIRAKIDEFLADPHKHGEPLTAYIERTGRVPWNLRKMVGPQPQSAAA